MKYTPKSGHDIDICYAISTNRSLVAIYELMFRLVYTLNCPHLPSAIDVYTPCLPLRARKMLYIKS